MANTFYKVSQSYDRENYINTVIQSYEHSHCDLVNLSTNEDLYSLISDIEKHKIKLDKKDVNELLKYYLLKQILERDAKQVLNVNKYIKTFNPDIKKDLKGNYYRVTDNDITEDNSILEVNEDGSYIVRELKDRDSYKVLKTYSDKHELTEIKITSSSGRIIKDQLLVAKVLKLHKEYQTKYRYSGVSGNSNDTLNKILNKFFKPQSTGYYMDVYCSAWKWDNITFSFKRVLSREYANKQPLSVDIKFLNDGTVLRQEYAGI